MSLDTEIKKRISSNLLIQLTRPDGTATTVDQDVLDSAYSDVEGAFQREVGQALDVTLKSHLATAIDGTLYYLELYKGRDANLIRLHQENFFRRLELFRKRTLFKPFTTSVLKVSDERTDAKPDMDRKGILGGLEITENNYGSTLITRSPQEED